MPRGINDYDTAILQRRLWTPAVLRPGAWFDADDLSTITIATGVSEWRDKSGNGRNATQTTGGNQPALSVGSFNGRNTLLFDGVDDFMTYDGTFLVNSSYFISAVIARRSSTGPNGRNMFLGGNSTTSNQNLHIGWHTNTSVRFAQYNNDLDGSVGGYSGTPVLNCVSCSKIISAGGGSSIFYDGNQIASNSNTDGLSAYTTAYLCRYEGGGSFANQYYNMTLAELIFIATSDGNITSRASIQKCEGYLSWKWGVRLAADHPYANRPPLIGD